MRYLIITDDNIAYTPTGHIQAFITGALLQHGVRGKKLQDLGNVIEDIYLKVQHIDLGDIVDYVYYNDDKVGIYTRMDWVNVIVGEQW